MKLRDLPQWVCWRLENRDGEPTKVPYSPHTHRRASSTDPETWGTVRDARRACAESNGKPYDGIGFVFTAEDPFCGVDLDDCVNDEGRIASWALEIVEQLDSYTEASPSGTGLHIILRAKVPEGGNRKGDIEIYDRGRFFTITGEHLEGAPTTVEERQEELEELHARLFASNLAPSRNGSMPGGFTDEEILAKAMRAANGGKFAALWSGDWQRAGYDSQSEADLALCSMIAFWTGPDEARVEDLFSMSGLAREKWERADYRQRTVRRALAGAEFYSPPVTDRDGRDTWDADREEDARILPAPEAVAFPVEAMPPACRHLIEEAVGCLGCAPELVALPMLAALSSAIGASLILQIKRGWTEGATLFLASVASPGSMKSPAAGIAVAPVHERQEEFKRSYAEKKADYEREYREWEVDRRIALKDGEPSPPPPEPPAMRRAIAADATLEALVGVLEDNPRGLLVHRDELAGWVRSMDQYKSGGKGSDRQHWLSMWDNQAIVVDRKARMGEPIILARPFISLYGGIQPAMLGELGGVMQDGMTDRFLYGYPAARHIRYNDREISAKAEAAYAALYRRLSGLLLATDEHGTPNPKPLTLSFEAKRRFAGLVDALGAEVHKPGFPARLEGVWSKMRGYLARLSLILAVCRCVGDGIPEQVEEEDVEAAGELIGYFKAHARRVYAELREADPLDSFGAELMDFLKEEGGEWAGTPTELLAKLEAHDVEALPANAVNLTKRVLAVAARSGGLEAKRGKSDGKRVLRLALKSTVPSDPELLPNRDSRDTTDSKAEICPVRTEECIHGFVEGAGCYLCDPNHPYRLEEEGAV